MWPCQQPSAPRPGFLGRRLRCASIRRACAGSPGPRSPRSADGPVIIISRPVLPDHFLAPWTAVSLASLRRRLKSHFSSVLYFAHSINLECDPAPGSVHLCLASGRSSPEGCFFPPSFSPPLLFHPRSRAIQKKNKKFPNSNGLVIPPLLPGTWDVSTTFPSLQLQGCQNSAFMLHLKTDACSRLFQNNADLLLHLNAIPFRLG